MDYKPYELAPLMGLFALLRSSNVASATERKAQAERKRKILSWAVTSPEAFLAALAEAPDMHSVFARYFDVVCREGGKLISINRASRQRIRAALAENKLPPIIALTTVNYLDKIAAMAQEAVNKGYISKMELLKHLGKSIANI